MKTKQRYLCLIPSNGKDSNTPYVTTDAKNKYILKGFKGKKLKAGL